MEAFAAGDNLRSMSNDGSASDSTANRLKSAYELALERMQSSGIEPPRDEAFDAETLDAIAEVRSQAEAKLAEMEILHKKKMAAIVEPSERQREDEGYQAERRRIEERQVHKIEQIRATAK